VRAAGELHEVARRERLGLHREEHSTVRTEAVWAIVIAAARPIAVALVFLIPGMTGAVSRPMHPVLPNDELGEILERLRADEEEADLALDHLDELGPQLSTAELDRALDAIDAGFGHDEETEAWVRSGVIDAIVGSPLILEQSARLARLYPTLAFDAREHVLDRYAEIGTRESLTELASLAGADHDPEGPTLPLTLSWMHADADVFVGPLVRLPADARLRIGVPLLLRSLCDGGLDTRVLEPVRGRLIADWLDMRDELPPPAPSLEVRTSGDHGWPVVQAGLQLGALRCVEGADVDALLVEASAHPDSLVAVAAVRALLARGDTVSRVTLNRLAADPFSRADLYAALSDRGREREMPALSRTERALAEGQLIRELRFDGGDPLIALGWVARVEPRPGAGVHVFEVTARDGTEEPRQVAIGPYPAALTMAAPRIRWMDEGESFNAALLAAAVVSDWERERALDDELHQELEDVGLDDLDLDDLDGDPL
jgi:hypothetical protein